MFFNLQHTTQNSAARAGVITTDHGQIETPIFMPVGTAGTVKCIHQHQLIDPIKAQIILGNTYHLYLRPGTDIIQEAGGLHKFIGWSRPMLTDSGGYQVYSLAANRKIEEEGVTFRSHIDGSAHLFTPERSLDIQHLIGADIIMAFDECPPYPSTKEYTETSMELTHRWLDRCVVHQRKSKPKYGHQQHLFPIVQGGSFDDLRRKSCEYIADQDMPGNAIGGLSVGEPTEDMYRIAKLCCEILPPEKPRYLMGVGTPANLLECIDRGVDMFDCVLPTRNARHGLLYTADGIVNIRNKKWANDHSFLDLPFDNGQAGFRGSEAPTALEAIRPAFPQHTKAYLRHLIHTKEALGAMVCSLHNLTFFLWLVGQARTHILNDTFAGWKKEMVGKLASRL
ncbi:MAG: tRNA guanosine(34) transglycosylase Tgt [Bacteroidota bacterium]